MSTPSWESFRLPHIDDSPSRPLVWVRTDLNFLYEKNDTTKGEQSLLIVDEGTYKKFGFELYKFLFK